MATDDCATRTAVWEGEAAFTPTDPDTTDADLHFGPEPETPEFDFEDSPRKVLVANAARPTHSGKRTSRVLVIDDDAIVAKVIVRVLSEQHDVEVESSGARALERLLGGETFDVVICDLMMPEITGMDVYDVLASRLPKEAAKLVFLTGGAFTAHSRAFLASVPNARLEKPFDACRLRALVRSRVP